MHLYPFEEPIKRIILDHEIIFNNQVQELHRLNAVQTSVMKGDSKYPRCQLFPMKRTFTDCHSVGSTRFVSNGSFLQEDQNFDPRFQQRHLDLRLSTNNSSDYNVLDGDELNLSLSIGRSTNKRSKISGSSWKNKIVYPSSHDIIDLEESTETGSNEDQSSQNSTDHLKNVANLHQDYLKTDPCSKKTESSLNVGMNQEGSSFSRGSSGWHDVKQTVFMDFDLNKVQPDESSFHSDDPVGPNPSSDGSCDESCNQIPTSLTFKGQTSAKYGQTKTCTIDLESIPEPSSDLTEEKDINISEASSQKEIKKTNYAVEKAALSLISISQLRTLTKNQDSETKTGSNEIEKNSNENKKKTIKRSSSIDSYESLVLKIEESNIDEDSATSEAFEINEFDQKQNGIKLKRGRRMKDFQKDVLPTLSSLSKHEIWEDIKLLEGIIRSREYKRLNKAKTGKGENWFTPVKSKRSKVKYVSPKCSLRKKK